MFSGIQEISWMCLFLNEVTELESVCGELVTHQTVNTSHIGNHGCFIMNCLLFAIKYNMTWNSVSYFVFDSQNIILHNVFIVMLNHRSRMFLTLKELVNWLGMTSFEICVHLISIFVFTVLIVLKMEAIWSMTWWQVFIPLFVADGINTYFCIIVFLRQFQDYAFKHAGLRLLSSLLCFSLLFVFKFLLCQKLSEYHLGLTYPQVSAPLFPLWLVLCIRSCQTSNN